eukprot:10229521-Lingulodinium_polyedra.AAC.1
MAEIGGNGNDRPGCHDTMAETRAMSMTRGQCTAETGEGYWQTLTDGTDKRQWLRPNALMPRATFAPKNLTTLNNTWTPVLKLH